MAVMETNWNQVLGHKQQIAELRAMLREGRLPHALLFTGPEGIGKRKVAHVLAAALLCGKGDAPCGSCTSCRYMRADTHPDYLEVIPEKRGKGTSIICIEQIREMQTMASRYPIYSGQHVIVIDEADRMNEAAANSLLKTLEEPEGAVTFILVTSARSALLDTILSRCMPMAFGMLEESEIIQVLAGQGIASDEAEKLAALSDGSPARALKLHEDGGIVLRDDALAFLQGRASMGMQAMWKRAAEMGEMDREKVAEWFLYINMLLRDMLVLYEDGGSPLLYHKDCRDTLMALLFAYPERRIFALLALVRDMQRRLQTNASLRLQVEGFLIRARDL